MSCVCVRAFIRGCAVRKKTSPLDVPKTKAHKLPSALSQEGSDGFPGGPAGAGRAAGHRGQPRFTSPGRALLPSSPRCEPRRWPPTRKDRALPGKKIVTTSGCIQMFGFPGPVTHGVDLADRTSKKRELLFIF